MQSNGKTEVGSKPPDQISRLINAKRAPAPLPEGVRDSTRRLVEVPIDQIGRSPQQARHAVHEDDPKVKELALSIKALGLLVPITIRRNPEVPGAYLLVMGESRLTAHRLLAREDERFKYITAMLAEGATTDAEASFMGLAENINRSELTPLEEGEEYARQLGRGETADSIAQKLGLKRDRVKRCLTLAGAPEAVRKVLRDGVLVPKYGEDGKPLPRTESTASSEEDGAGATSVPGEEADRIQRHRIKITDLVLQLTIVTLYLHLERNAKSKRHLEESFQRHLDKIVGQGFSVRAAQAYVKDVGAGRKPRAVTEGAEKSGDAASPPGVMEAQAAGFRSSAREFYVDLTRLDSLTQEQRQGLVAALRGLLTQLGE